MSISSFAAPSIVDRVSQAFNFTVDKFPLSGPDGMRTPWYGMFRSDTNAVVGNGSVTARYCPHQTEDVLALVDAAASAFDGIGNVDCYFRDGHYVAIQPTKEERRAIFGTADNVFPRIIIRAGYDGKAFNAAIGYYRDACRNLAILREVTGTTVSIRHTSGLRSKMDSLIGSFNVLRESWGNLTTVIQHLEGTRVSLADFLREVYGEPSSDTGREATIHRNRTEAIFNRVANERLRTGRGTIGSDFMVSGWEAFNAVQGFVQHDATRKSSARGSAVSGFGRIIAAANDAAVHRAERAAMQLLAA
jgi:hypothetical protein